MTFTQVIRQLRSSGNAQTRKVYGRHGVSRAMFGVSYADLGRLEKAIQVDHALAVELWESGNHDACVLATMIADPGQMTSRQLDSWARQLDSYVIADAFSRLVARSGVARRKFEQWRDRGSEFVGQVAWTLLSTLALRPGDLPDEYFEEQLVTIEREVHGRKNRVRYSMNQALIAIGMRNAALERKVIAAVKRIGRVKVDHGETGCKTPDPIPYIKRAKARKKKSVRKK